MDAGCPFGFGDEGSSGHQFRLDDGDIQGDLEVGLGDILFKVNVSLEYFHPALNVFQTEAEGTFVHFLEIILGDAPSIVVESQEETPILDVLGDVHETGVAVFQHIVDEFLYDAEYEQFLFRH